MSYNDDLACPECINIYPEHEEWCSIGRSWLPNWLKRWLWYSVIIASVVALGSCAYNDQTSERLATGHWGTSRIKHDFWGSPSFVDCNKEPCIGWLPFKGRLNED